MKRFSFGTFLVDDSNRKAYELCRDAANLKPLGPGPFVLLGDPGCGKTHLLYSIVNRTRAESTGTGVAYITADDFPKQVRKLARDPSPVQRATSAILIVDSLERFKDSFDDLEAVIRVFMASSHYVLLATSVHPSRLRNLTQGLRSLLDQGGLVEMLPQDAANSLEQMAQRIRKEAEEVISRQMREIEELRAQTEAAGDADADQSATAETSEAEAELEELRAQMVGAKSELEHLRAENSLLSVSAREVGPLRARIEELQDQYEEVHSKLESAEVEASPAREEANEVLCEAEALMGEVQNERPESSEMVQNNIRHLEEVRGLEAALADESNDEARGEASVASADEPLWQEREATLRSQFQMTQDQLRDSFKTVEGRQKDEIANQQFKIEAIATENEKKEKDLDKLRAEMERAKSIYSDIQAMVGQANEEIDRLGKGLDDAVAERDRLRENLSKIRDGHEARKAELENAQAEAGQLREEAEAIRREADERKAGDAARIEALEGELAKAGTERDQACQMNRVVSEQLRALRTVLSDGSETVDVLARTLGTEPEARIAGQVDTPAPAAGAPEAQRERDGSGSKKKDSESPVESNVVTAEFGRRAAVAPDQEEEPSSLHHVEQLQTDRDMAPPDDTDSKSPQAQEDLGND